jgi:hypothetical protein
MKQRFVLAGALLVALTTSALAQHDHGAGKTKEPEMDPAAMQAMIAAGTPGDPHKKLDVFAGTWDTKITMWMMPGSDPMTSAGTSTNAWVMGGRYLEQRFKGDFGGMPFEGLGYNGYDNVKKQYWGSWMDNMSTAIMMSTGSLAADGKTWTFDATMPDPMTGKDQLMKEKLTVVDADHHVMEMWMPAPDGKLFKSMEIAYSRKK